ncbi:MAG: carboxypeptidase regulatory-like domain-containing protein [Gemmatimonadota bacterium]
MTRPAWSFIIDAGTFPLWGVVRIVQRCTLFLLFLLSVAPLGAQTVKGRLLEEGSGRPVEGAFILLVDEAGRQRAAALTDAQGHFSIQAPGPGDYGLKVERIGYRSARSLPFPLEAGAVVERDLTAPVEAVLLIGITVPMEQSHCEASPKESERLAEVWEEARKALAVTAWTRSREAFRLQIRRYERELDAKTLRVREETSEKQVGLNRGSPFVSRPADELAAEGWAEFGPEMVRYFGPDAEVLLSDVFLDRYCFRLEEPSDEDGLIGLAFRPEERGETVDIEGVLWVDEASAELRVLDYEYVGLPWRVGEGQAGGRVEFERLPSGAWIVSRWRIRAPAVERSRGREYEVSGGMVRSYAGGPPRDRVRAVFETGGAVEEIRTEAGALLRSSETAGLAGTVVDSTRGTPLAGAEVRLAGTGHHTVTDGAGRFRLGGLPGGEYTLAVTHARLDSLELPPLERPVALQAGHTGMAGLAIPSLTTILAAACEGERSPGTTVLVGVVRDSASGIPLPGAEVALSWDLPDPAHIEVQADSRGRFAACRVPAMARLTAEAGFLDRHGQATLTMLGNGGPVRHDFALAGEAALVEGRESRITIETRQAGGRVTIVTGRVTSEMTGRPLDGVQVALAGTGVGTTTDEEGRFRLAVSPGEHALEMVRLGYRTGRLPMAMAPGEEVSLVARLVPEPVPAEPLAVEALSPDALADRRSGWTTYRITAEEVERYPAMGIVEVIALSVPGAEIGEDPDTGCKVPIFRVPGSVSAANTLSLSQGAARAAPSPYRAPLIVIEGTPLLSACELATINPEDIERIDVVPGLFGVSRFGAKAEGGVIQIAIKAGIDRQPDIEAVRGEPEPARPPEGRATERVQ